MRRGVQGNSRIFVCPRVKIDDVEGVEIIWMLRLNLLHQRGDINIGLYRQRAERTEGAVRMVDEKIPNRLFMSFRLFFCIFFVFHDEGVGELISQSMH